MKEVLNLEYTRKTQEITCKLPVNYQKYPPETGGSVKYCVVPLLWVFRSASPRGTCDAFHLSLSTGQSTCLVDEEAAVNGNCRVRMLSLS